MHITAAFGIVLTLGSLLASVAEPEVLPNAREVFKAVDGIGEVIGPERFAALGLPMPERDSQMFQLLLTAKSGYSFSGAKGGPVTAAVPQQAGSHGYLASDPDMDAIFIASGVGVKPGTKLGRVANIDVAPTIAKLLNGNRSRCRSKSSCCCVMAVTRKAIEIL